MAVLSLRLQRILRKAGRFNTVSDSRINASSLHKGEFFDAPSVEQPRKSIISFNTAWLVINFVRFVALLGELLFGGPWPVHTVGSSTVTSYARVVGLVRVQRSTICRFSRVP